MAVLTVNGVEMPSPSSMKVEIFDVGSFGERSASGRLVSDRIAVKRKLALKWACLTPEQLGRLLGAVGQAAFFEVGYPDPETGGAGSMVCACSERTAGVLMIRDDRPVWTDVEMEWIER